MTAIDDRTPRRIAMPALRGVLNALTSQVAEAAQRRRDARTLERMTAEGLKDIGLPVPRDRRASHEWGSIPKAKLW
jgi:uncharacterized protein YjiS (DUF1127 family)